jgi:hypothetical protein
MGLCCHGEAGPQEKDRKSDETRRGAQIEGPAGNGKAVTRFWTHPALAERNRRFLDQHRQGEEKVDAMSSRKNIISQGSLRLFEELEQECLTAVKYIQALKGAQLTDEQKEDILGELSASITHLRIQTSELDAELEALEEI